MPIEYAQALTNSLEGVTKKEDALNRVDALVQALQKAGKQKALPAILREFKRIQLRKNAQKPTLTLAKAGIEKNALVELVERLGEKQSDIAIETDENLVGGWRYVNHDMLLDTSYKAALLELYRHVTTV